MSTPTPRRVYSRSQLLSLRPAPPVVAALKSHPVSPPTPFRDLIDVPHAALSKLSLVEATSVQASFLPLSRLGVDAIVHSPPASGKTLAFLLACLHLITPSQLSVIILAPTRELAVQISRVFSQLVCAQPPESPRPAVVTLIGGCAHMTDVAKLAAKPEVVVATPARLAGVMAVHSLQMDHVRTLILDEADRLLDQCFVGDIKHIVHALPKRQTFAFSATFSPPLATFLAQLMNSPTYLRVPEGQVVESKGDVSAGNEEGEKEEEGGVKRDNIPPKQFRLRVSSNLCDRLGCLVWLLNTHTAVSRPASTPSSRPLCLVFFDSRDALPVAQRVLSHHGIRSRYIHSGLPQALRTSTMGAVRSGAVRILLTTDLMSRGIDLLCTSVVQLAVPYSADVYKHRVGRAGRTGDIDGCAYVMYTDDEQWMDLGAENVQMMENEGVPVMNSVLEMAQKAVAKPDVADGEKKGKRGGKKNAKKRKREEQKKLALEMLKKSRMESEENVQEEKTVSEIPNGTALQAEPCLEETPSRRAPGTDGMNVDVPEAEIPRTGGCKSSSDGVEDDWDRYAKKAYDEGYRRAYEDAYRMALNLRSRLGLPPLA